MNEKEKGILLIDERLDAKLYAALVESGAKVTLANRRGMPGIVVYPVIVTSPDWVVQVHHDKRVKLGAC